MYTKFLFTPTFITCGARGVCIVKNDDYRPVTGARLTVAKVQLSSGAATTVYSDAALALPAGPGAARFFTVDATIDGHEYVLHATVVSGSGAMLTDNWIPLLPPANWTALPRAPAVSFIVAPAPRADGLVDIAVTTNALAAFVTLTTLAQGRFSDNAFFLPPGTVTVQYVPFGDTTDYDALVSTLRIEHVASYM